MKKNEHPGCGCPQCQRGLRRPAGHFIVRQVTKKIRRLYRVALRRDPFNVEQFIVSTPYTD